MAEMPYLGIFPYCDIVVNIGTLMQKIAHQLNLPLKSVVEQTSKGSFTGLPSAADL